MSVMKFIYNLSESTERTDNAGVCFALLSIKSATYFLVLTFTTSVNVLEGCFC